MGIISNQDFKELLSKAVSINGDDETDLGFVCEHKNYYLVFGGNETKITVDEFVKQFRSEWQDVSFSSTHTEKMYDVITKELRSIKNQKLEDERSLQEIYDEQKYGRADTIFNECY